MKKEHYKNMQRKYVPSHSVWIPSSLGISKKKRWGEKILSKTFTEWSYDKDDKEYYKNVNENPMLIW